MRTDSLSPAAGGVPGNPGLCRGKGTPREVPRGLGAGFKLLKHYRHLARDLLDAEWAAARDFAPDAIISHPKALGAPHVAQKLAIPLFLASPLPGFTPTAEFPTPICRSLRSDHSIGRAMPL